MTDDEKLTRVRTLLLDSDEASDELLSTLLEQAKAAILRRRYPFGYTSDTEMPSRYDELQCQIAVEMYSKMGAEGEMSHSAGGITRSYETGAVSTSLLKQVVPLVGGVSSDA